MSIYSCTKTGNFSSTASWEFCTNTPNPHATTNVGVTTTGTTITTSWTAPNTTDSVTGVWVYAAGYPAAGRNWTAQLQQSGSSVGVMATILQTDMPVTPGWIYFKLGTPFTYTTVSANAYRFVIKSTTANSGSLAADASTTTSATMVPTDTRTAVPSTSDRIFVGSPNCNTAVTLTVDSSNDLRGGSANTGITRNGSLGCFLGGALVDSTVIMKFDTTASASLLVQGDFIVVDGGELQIGTVASPYPSANTATLSIRQTSGTVMRLASLGTGKIISVGTPPTNIAVNFVSGLGTAASPMITDGDIGIVGDKVLLDPTSNNVANYSEAETRFIITKNSSTSYVLSNTSGGSENALANTHTGGKVLNITRNVNITQLTFAGTVTPGGATSGYNVFKSVYFSGLGSTAGTPDITSSIYGLLVANGIYANVDYCVFDQPQAYSLILRNRTATTFESNIFCGNTVTTTGTWNAGLGIDGANHTFNNHYFINNARQGLDYRGVNCTFNNAYFAGNNTSNSTNNGGLSLASGGPVSFSSPQIHANRGAGIVLNTTQAKFVNGHIGDVGVNTLDALVVSNSANKAIFTNCMMGSSTIVSNYLNGAVGGTLVAFDKLNQTANNHKWYTNYGSAQSTGASLSDTLVKTTGSLGLRLASENASPGFDWRFNIPAPAGQIISFFGWVQKNTAFGTDVAKIELFLPGNDPDTGTADASYTVSNVTGAWEAVSISAANTGNTVDLLATVKITGRTTTASAYLYADTFYNADTTQKLTGLDIWKDGQPADIILPTAVSAADIWTFSTSALTTSGTTGKQLRDSLSFDDFIGLK